MLRKLLFVLFLIGLAGCSIEPIQIETPPNIILVSIDTCRADRLGLYGNPRPVSPILDRLSQLGHLFCSITSQSPLTAPSHMTMFTSRYPEVHRVKNIGDGSPVTLSPSIPTLTEQLKQAGYGTVACTDGGNVNGGLGFSRGFDMYNEIGAEQFYSLVKLQPREPWFAFMHTYWVHDPYIVPHPFDTIFDRDYSGGIKGSMEDYGEKAARHGVTGFRREFWETVDYSKQSDREHLLNLYDASIRMVDISLQGLVNLLDELSLKDNTILIITADHGEEFFEHSRILHERLYEETLHVPLIFIDFRKPGSDHLIGATAQLVDLAPTILDYLNLPPLPGAQGQALTAGLRGQTLENRVVHSMGSLPYCSRLTGKSPWKYIYNTNRSPNNTDAWTLGLPRPTVPEEELYNLFDDPAETENLSTTHSKKLKELRAMHNEHHIQMQAVTETSSGEGVQVDSEAMSKLKALGYVE